MGENSDQFQAPVARVFRATVHGLAFGNRAALLARVREGDTMLLIPDPPVQPQPQVWVHLETGEPIGHLPDEINGWLARWLHEGGRAAARVVRVGSPHVPSWRRLVVEVTCEGVAT
ncbi:MAG: hypothetical protein HY702_01135 [Gemmatimonadetes bacterium]|nr:hypothetical protein [Gemmatimonadota bacterium]